MRTPLLVWVFATFANVGTAAVIDTFATGNQGISWPPAQGGAAITDETPIAGSIFDTRFLHFKFGGPQSLTVTTSEQILEYTLGPEGRGYFQFGYRSASPVILLGGGQTVLRFSFEDAKGGRSFPASLRIATTSGTASYSWNFALTDIFRNNDGAFHVDVPLSEINGGDLSQVTELTFDAYRIAEGAGFRLTRIETIPEPGPTLLFLLATLPFAFRRTRDNLTSGHEINRGRIGSRIS